MEFGINFILKNQTSVLPKAMFVICDFNPEVGKPIGGLVNEMDTNHKNPQFTIMVDCGIFFITFVLKWALLCKIYETSVS